MSGPGPLSGTATFQSSSRPAGRAEASALPGIAVRRDWALPGERPRRDVPLTIEVHPGFDAMRLRSGRNGKPQRTSRGVAIVAGLLAIITLAVAVAALVATGPASEPEIVSVAPATTMLAIADVEAIRTTSNGWPLLRIEGTVDNRSGGEQVVPPIQLATRDANGTLIALGFAMPATPVLAPGERTTFTADFSDMRGRGEDIVVTFEDIAGAQ